MMIRNRRLVTARQRRGTAVVEAAIAVPFLFTLMYGIWEVGRMVHVQQIVSNAVREGGRLSATGTQSASTLSNPNFQIQHAVANYIQNSGLPITTSGIVIKVTNVDKSLYAVATCTIDPGNATNTVMTAMGTDPTTDPVLGADQFDTIQVEASYPYSFARWSPNNLVFYLGDDYKVYASSLWPCMRDKAVAIDDTIPQAPLE